MTTLGVLAEGPGARVPLRPVDVAAWTGQGVQVRIEDGPHTAPLVAAGAARATRADVLACPRLILAGTLDPEIADALRPGAFVLVLGPLDDARRAALAVRRIVAWPLAAPADAAALGRVRERLVADAVAAHLAAHLARPLGAVAGLSPVRVGLDASAAAGPSLRRSLVAAGATPADGERADVRVVAGDPGPEDPHVPWVDAGPSSWPLGAWPPARPGALVGPAGLRRTLDAAWAEAVADRAARRVATTHLLSRAPVPPPPTTTADAASPPAPRPALAPFPARLAVPLLAAALVGLAALGTWSTPSQHHDWLLLGTALGAGGLAARAVPSVRRPARASIAAGLAGTSGWVALARLDAQEAAPLAALAGLLGCVALGAALTIARRVTVAPR